LWSGAQDHVAGVERVSYKVGMCTEQTFSFSMINYFVTVAWLMYVLAQTQYKQAVASLTTINFLHNLTPCLITRHLHAYT